MHWGKRGPGTPSRRRRDSYRPDSESLEGRRLLTTFDLTQTQTAPYGVEFVGKASFNTAGYTVTDVGNVTGSGYDSFVIAATGDSNTTPGSKPLNPSFTNGSAVYLVFGSKTVNSTSVSNWLSTTVLTPGVVGTTGALVSGDRAGDLGELGTIGVAAQTDIPAPTAQTNPTVLPAHPGAGLDPRLRLQLRRPDLRDGPEHHDRPRHHRRPGLLGHAAGRHQQQRLRLLRHQRPE